MAKNKDMRDEMFEGHCRGGMCGKCRGGGFLVVGLIILANALWPFLNWTILLGILLVLIGVSRLIGPCCGHCS